MAKLTTNIMRKQSLEEERLTQKRAELASLESALSQCELDLATIQAELYVFENKYLGIVGPYLAELDEIEAQIAEAEARLRPSDNTVKKHAERARFKARESSRFTEPPQEISKQKRFDPSETLKTLYRKLVKRFHPDLAISDEEEHVRRTELMTEINRAYRENDENRLQAILLDSKEIPETEYEAKLFHITQRITQIKKRLHAVKKEISELGSSEISELKKRFEVEEGMGRDLLAEMASDLRNKIYNARHRLEELRMTKE